MEAAGRSGSILKMEKETGLPPLHRIDQVPEVLLQKIVDRLQRVGVGRDRKIKGAPDKMTCRVRYKKLIAGGRIALQREVDAPGARWRGKFPGLDGGGLIRVLLIGKGKGVVHQRVQFVRADLLVRNMDPSIETGKIDIDPIGVFGLPVKKQGILDYFSVHGVFEGIRITGLIEKLISFWGQGDGKVSPGTGAEIAVAGNGNSGYQDQGKKQLTLYFRHN